MSDISPETTSSSGSRRRQIFPENLSRSSTSQQQGYERANMAPSPSAVDGRAAITQGCASARNELNKRAPAPHVPPAARDSAAARSRRAGHPARSGAWGPGQPRVNGWCSRGQATTRAPQPPNAALITRVLRPYPALSRSRPLDVNPRARPQGPRRAPARGDQWPERASPPRTRAYPRGGRVGTCSLPVGSSLGRNDATASTRSWISLASFPLSLLCFFVLCQEGLRWDTVSIRSFVFTFRFLFIFAEIYSF